MASVDALPPDQRAVLQLLLGQGKSYADLAGLLALDPDAVRRRAHAAVAALGPRGGATPDTAHQEAIADYLLGQQPVSERAATRGRLESFAPDRAWARVVASELRPLARDDLPEIPAEAAEVHEAFDALKARTAAREHAKRSSRLGGVLLLGGLGVILAVVLVLILGGGDAKKSGSASTASTASTATTTTGGTTQVVAQVNFKSPNRNGKALGVGQVVRRAGQPGVVIQGQGLAQSSRSFAYAVWLYNSRADARRLGFVNPGVGKDGRLVAVSGLPANASRFRNLIVTRETSSRPKRPGAIVLIGKLSLSG